MLLFLIGNILQLLQHVSIENEIKDSIFIFLISLSVPVIILETISEGSITVWAIPLTFLMLAVIFNQRKMIYYLGVITLLTQIFVLIMAPREMVLVDGFAYAVRLLITGIALLIALYVNKIYIIRLEQNETQINYQKMVSRISTNFITATEFNLVDKIKNLLVESGTTLGVDRCSFYVFDQGQKTMSLRYEWCNEGIEPTKLKVWNLPQNAFSICMQQIKENEIVYIPEVEVLDPEVFVIKKELQERHIRTFVGVPVKIKEKELGLISYESLKEIKVWRKEELNNLEIIVNILVDAIRKVEAEKEVNYMAYYDSLTGLPNRVLFKNRVENCIQLAKNTKKMIGVFFIDLDSFRGVNDSVGHGGGDELLKEVGARLTNSISDQDMVARFGGDKFLIKITDISDMEEIHHIAEKVLGTFKKPVLVRGQEFFTGASMGIAVYPQDGEDGETLIKNAELAMYMAKDKGKNQYTVCSPEIKEDLLRKVTLTNNLFRALERNELLLHYQPQVDIATGEIIGVEALLRWKHSELGMISPGLFIPLAEQTGLIHPIGQWVLETACRQSMEWQSKGLTPIRMSVNLSLEQFKNPYLIRTITRTLNKTGLNPNYLELEITESIAAEEADSVLETLHKLKDLGISIAIDDFGTEYSSLSRLKALPMDRIKIAMEFIHGITEEKSRDRVIAEIIIKLAKSLGLKVIAEGVETEAQVEFLAEQGCDEIQGYYYYKPMAKEELEKVLISGIEKAN
ncbi:MAG: EAL domain-containing protein [Desulfitobacterium sp.]|nr:EAL domain-containing protein [Desulfitobacterium sp.]